MYIYIILGDVIVKKKEEEESYIYFILGDIIMWEIRRSFGFPRPPARYQNQAPAPPDRRCGALLHLPPLSSLPKPPVARRLRTSLVPRPHRTVTTDPLLAHVFAMCA